MSRSYGEASPSLTAEWAPLPGASWCGMTGQLVSSDFGEPVDCSAYFFDHHRYKRATIRVVEQQGSRALVRIEAHGDIDNLGIPKLTAEQWLDFDGIYLRPTR
jgi:hypothetical protein